MSVRLRALCHAVGSQRQHGRSGIVGQDAGVACGPPGGELRSVQEGGHDDRGPDRPHQRCEVVVLREVLAYERDQGELSQEHGVVHAKAPAAIDGRFKVGETVEIVPNHSCLTVANFDRYHVMEGGRETASWKVERGRGT